MKPFISIVIPVYNSDKYIEKCIKSITSQTFNNYEVIIIDDGSTDNSLSVIKKNINNKFKIISQKNSGAGMARNVGINMATGKYITFMDSDDFFLDKYCLEKISRVLLKEDCDVAVYKMVRYYEKKNKFLFENDITTNDMQFKNVYDYLYFTIENSRLSVSQCDKIVKLDIIKKYKIFFEKMSMLEDIDWSLKLYEKIKTIKIINEPVYVYRQNINGSVSSFYNEKKIEDCISFISRWCKKCKSENFKYKSLYLNYISYQYTIMMAALSKKNCSKEYLNKLKENKWLLKYDLNFKVKKVNSLYKLLGYTLTIIVLRIYIHLKEKNIILIR